MSNVTISESRLKYLESRDEILSALEVGGVDNWEWYSESLQEAGLLEDEEEEDDE